MIAVQIKNMDTVVKRFSDMQKRAMSPAPAMAVVTNKAYKHVIQHFEDEQGPTGKWASLKGPRYFADIGKMPISVIRNRIGTSYSKKTNSFCILEELNGIIKRLHVHHI